MHQCSVRPYIDAIIMLSKRITLMLLYTCLLSLIVIVGFNPFQSNSSRLDSETLVAAVSLGEVKTSGVIISRVAPGELLPISVKLLNFGGGRRVDVTITYSILDGGGGVLVRESETVAVETTSNFVKLVQVPYDTASGVYTALANIQYAGQEVPATSSFQFNVERKIAGMFVSQFIIYGVILFAVAIAFAVVARLLMRRRRSSRFIPHDYSHIPKYDRLFYEMISDTIMQMRSRVGDHALELARDIDGLIVDELSGKILKITKNPAKIIALLVLRYEQQLGEKVSFALRRVDEETKEKLKPVDKNLVIVRKYFNNNNH